MRPLIGIPPCLDVRGRSGCDTQHLDAAYARAVDAAGGAPVLVPVQEDAAGLAERIDGLLVPGGGDFAPPAPYPAAVRFALVAPSQLDFDGRLLEAALALRRPLLGICYGMQLLALRRGGSLVYDIPSEAPAAAGHQLAGPDERHGLRLEPGSRLAALLGDAPAAVNSRHHQAVREPGAGLRVAARAPDGVIEAIEADAGFCIGVQWHPEGMQGPHRERLFGAFVAACAEARGRERRG
jgi:putative glutamine amidotransferase